MTHQEARQFAVVRVCIGTPFPSLQTELMQYGFSTEEAWTIIAHAANSVTDEQRQQQRNQGHLKQGAENELTVIVFSAIPTLSFLVAMMAGMLEIALLVARVMFNKNHPSDFKIALCTVVLILATAIRWWWSRTHPGQLSLMRQMQREGQFRPGITWRAAWLIVATIIGFSVFGTWVFVVP